MKPDIVLGTMTFGRGDGGRIEDVKEIQDILKLYQKYGKELDTARMYCDGNTEQVLGELAIKDQFKVATKVFPFTPGDLAPEKLKIQFSESLAALGTNQVDILYLHAPDYSVPIHDTLKAMNELYLQKKFIEFGLSNYPAWHVMEIYKICEHNGYVKPTVYQGRYNIISRDVEAELFPCLRRLGIRFYAYNPLSGGLLASNWKMDSVPTNGRFHGETAQGKKYQQRFWKEAYFKALDQYRDICEQFHLSPSEVALRWLMNHSKLTLGDAVIIGASSITQAMENLNSLDKPPLPVAMLDKLDQCWNSVMPVAPSYFR